MWLKSPGKMTQEPNTQIIKQSICYRAKYRKSGESGPQTQHINPMLIVPHPKNRGGDPVKSIRTMQLNGTLATEGYDPLEANASGVAVEQRPAVAGTASGREFQDAFEKKLLNDPDMLASSKGQIAIAGSLAHSHLNCGMRNILGEKKGCECAAGSQKCECKASKILDPLGCYSVLKVAAHDEAWCRDCHSGLQWELLSWKMDEEDPGAALVISIALNKKNEAAMKTGHTEIWNTLVSLCKPSPGGYVKFEPVRDKLIELYGAAADHPDVLNAFKVVCDAGGAESVHLKELQEFTSVYVNPKLRKMRFEAYAVIAQYPVSFPRLKNASLKWAWKQNPDKGWCVLPPSIWHRLNPESKTNMVGFAEELENAFCVLSAFATMVMATDAKGKTKWIAETEISLIAKFFQVPKTDPEKTKETQELELSSACAELIATKVLALCENTRVTFDKLPSNSPLMKQVAAHLADPKFGHEPFKKSVVTEPAPLEPRVIRMDKEGRPLSEHATAVKSTVKVVETIPWLTWAEAQPHDTSEEVKMLLSLAMTSVTDNCTNAIPLALVKTGSALQALTTRVLERGELAVPLYFKKQSSLVIPSDPGAATVHPRAACVTVSWTRAPSEAEMEAGVEGEGGISVAVRVQPELKLPNKNKKGDGYEWVPSVSLHPFWFIKRAEKNDEPNAEIKYQDMTLVAACGFEALNEHLCQKLKASADTFRVSLPFIVNTERLLQGTEVILKMESRPQENKKRKVTAETAFDQLAKAQAKAARAKAKAKGAAGSSKD